MTDNWMKEFYMTTTPDEVKGVWDNGKETLDQYSIHLLLDYETDVEEVLICSSEYPCHPQGVYSMAESNQFDVEDHLGLEAEWISLPTSVRRTVMNVIVESWEIRDEIVKEYENRG